MQGQSNRVETVLEHWDAWYKTFLEFKDSTGNLLGSLPYVCVGPEVVKEN